jgi:kumamolisin
MREKAGVMDSSEKVPLTGSASRRRASAKFVDETPEGTVQLVLLVRRRQEIPDSLITGLGTISRDELTQRYGADPGDISLTRDTMERLGIRVVSADAASRRVVVEGSFSTVTDVFGVQIVSFEATDAFTGSPARYRGHGELQLPAELDGVVVSVFGLDNQPRMAPMVRFINRPPKIVYTPPELAKLYTFPSDADGTGQTLAIITIAGGHRQEDIDAYFAQLGLPVPTITIVGVHGAQNSPAPADQAPNPLDVEAVLDVQVAGAVAPSAHIVNYFTPNTDAGFLETVRSAVHATPAPTVISMSFGGSEDEKHSGHFFLAMEELFKEAAALGITVCAATGDAGSGNDEHDGGSHVNYPASSPYVLAVGGTTIIGDPGTGIIQSETVWNGGSDDATGGGVSNLFDLPAWQARVKVPNRFGKQEKGRGIPDVAANADGDTGYQIVINGNSACVGGTSAATPLWAALICRMAQKAGRPFGLLQPLIYKNHEHGNVTQGFRDIVSGDNGSYAAAPGWDPNTGLGSPDGAALFEVLRRSTAPGTTH